MSIERFYKLRVVLRAFSLRDLQMVGVMLGWVAENGFTSEELYEAALVVPSYERLEQLGYFNSYQNVEELKEIRRLEKSLPKEIGRELRRIRLNNLIEGPVFRRG